MKQKQWLVIGILMVLSALTNIAAASPVASELGAYQRLLSTYRQFVQVDNYRLLAQLDLKLVDGNKEVEVAWTAVGDLTTQPFVFDGLMMQRLQSGADAEVKLGQVYLAENTETMDIYLKDHYRYYSRWSQQSLPLNGLDESQLLATVFNSIKPVSVLEQDADTTTIKVMVRPRLLLQQVMTAIGLERESFFGVYFHLAQEPDEAAGIIVIDNKTNLPKRIEVDLSECINKLAKRRLPLESRIPTRDLRMLADVLANVKVNCVIELSRFNQVAVHPRPSIIN